MNHHVTSRAPYMQVTDNHSIPIKASGVLEPASLRENPWSLLHVGLFKYNNLRYTLFVPSSPQVLPHCRLVISRTKLLSMFGQQFPAIQSRSIAVSSDPPTRGGNCLHVSSLSATTCTCNCALYLIPRLNLHQPDTT